jgi:hypothetical protein
MNRSWYLFLFIYSLSVLLAGCGRFDGVTYPGTNGRDGKDGKDGKDGSCVTMQTSTGAEIHCSDGMRSTTDTWTRMAIQLSQIQATAR